MGDKQSTTGCTLTQEEEYLEGLNILIAKRFHRTVMRLIALGVLSQAPRDNPNNSLFRTRFDNLCSDDMTLLVNMTGGISSMMAKELPRIVKAKGNDNAGH